MRRTIIILIALFSTLTTAYDVIGLKLYRDGDNTVAEVVTSGPATVKTAKLTGPDRLLIDLMGGVHRLKDSDLPPLPPGIVVEVRSAQFESDPPITRIVLVMAEPTGEVRTIDGPRSGQVFIPTPGYPDFPEWSIGRATPAVPSVEEPPVEPVAEPEPSPEPAPVEPEPEQPREPSPTRPPDPRRIQLPEEELQQAFVVGDTVGEGASYVRPRVVYRGWEFPDPFIVAKPVTEAQLGDESFPIVEDLKLVGVVAGRGPDKVAILQDARGWGYILEMGDSIRDGLVDEITDTTIVFDIEEFGVIRQVILTLPKEAFTR
ncbi:MAG TPA: AMIN domain-containing protein [candidate division Zixibacteria bacterium]|nr:AMIN domain-containing protein [candidate division Zixibacteria bacterium]